MKQTRWLVLVLLTLLTTVSCLKKTDYDAEEKKQIDDFLKANDITTPPTESGLYYLPQDTGTGLTPQVGDTVWINYVASYLSLVVFDTNIEDVAMNTPGLYDDTRDYEPLQFIVGDLTVIDGIDEAVKYMKAGGSSMLIIPSKLAYKDYQPLLFYIELLDVGHTK